MTKIFMGEFYNLIGLGLVKTIGKARNCETHKDMIILATILNGGLMGDTLLLNEEDFISRIEPK